MKLVKMNMINKFPENFVWGVSTSSYQIEGAVNTDGRGKTIWDTFCEVPGNIVDQTNGAVACDHYHRYPEDIRLMVELGAKAYRFSTAWSRVQPEGFGEVNQAGIDFYNRLLDSLLEHNIEPWLCLNHWDLPQGLENLGGWRNRETSFRFAEYAEIMARHLGDRIPYFITHNEPNVVALLGHGWGWHAPGIQSAEAVMAATHHLNLAHGLAVSAIRKTVPNVNIGTVITMQPVVDWDIDPIGSTRLDALFNRAFTDSALLGTYPELLFDELTPFVEEGDMELIHQSLDFFGLNHYTTMRARSTPENALGVEILAPPVETPQTIKGWEINPAMLYQQLLEFKDRYGNPPVYITESGCASPDEPNVEGLVSDPDRVAYFREYLHAASLAIEDGVNLKGYFAWSLLDNFEWAEGYTQRFGIIYVDFTTQKRIPKDSFYFLKNIFHNNHI